MSLLFIACVGVAAVLFLWPRLPSVAANALDRANQYELLSLDPYHPDSPLADDFHGHHVLGRTVIADVAVQHALSNALRSAVRPVFAIPPLCFDPRHGIRVKHAGQTTEFLICFECDQVQVWQEGQYVAHWSTNASPQPVFDEVLKRAGVPLPKPSP